MLLVTKHRFKAVIVLNTKASIRIMYKQIHLMKALSTSPVINTARERAVSLHMGC